MALCDKKTVNSERLSSQQRPQITPINRKTCKHKKVAISMCTNEQADGLSHHNQRQKTQATAVKLSLKYKLMDTNY